MRCAVLYLNRQWKRPWLEKVFIFSPRPYHLETSYAIFPSRLFTYLPSLSIHINSLIQRLTIADDIKFQTRHNSKLSFERVNGYRGLAPLRDTEIENPSTNGDIIFGEGFNYPESQRGLSNYSQTQFES
jgi:hypothetical protein